MKTVGDFVSGRENNFDFIRMIAAVSVLFSHSYPITFGDISKEPLLILTNSETNFGTAAVNIFFIISGFLVTQSFIRKETLKDYFRARILRIFPALIVMILLLVFVAGPLLTTLSATEYFNNKYTYRYLSMMYVFNNIEVQKLPGVFEKNPFHDTVNGSLWTIRYELVLYIALPAILLLFTKRLLASLLLTIFIICISINSFSAPGYIILSIVTCFLSGSIFYLFRKKIPLHRFIAVCAAGLLITSVPLKILSYTFPWLAGYLVIYLALVPKSMLTRFGKYGDFSYGVYIWAFPVQQVIAQTYSPKGSYFNALASFAIVLPIAIISWHLIEKPALKFKSNNA
jgi:peptidoglycan/LPS O-acetylase OafA/YrhL